MNEYDFRTPGLVRPAHNCEVETDPKELVKQQMPSAQGKEVCRQLREMRVALAMANDIPYYPMDCKNVKPCAGTCPVCDNEIRYINRELNKIPPEKRVYPEQYRNPGNGGA